MKKLLFSTLIFSFGSLELAAQWSGDPTMGRPVVTTSSSTTKLNNVSVSDGTNGMYVAWIDNRNATVPAIYIQRILPDGTLKFGSEVVVSNASGTTSSSKQNLVIIGDGAGGAILLWQDSRNRTSVITNDDIYGQRIDANGNVLWTANGSRVTVADNTVSNKITPAADVLNGTEALIVFGDNRNGTVDLFAQKISLATGAPLWGSDVSVHGAQANTQNQQQVANDGAGGAYIIWQDQRTAAASADVYAQRLDNAGSVVSGWAAGGNVVANGANIQNQPQLVSLGTNGLVTTWEDSRSGVGAYDIYIQRLDASGVAQWTAGGVALCTATLGQTNPQIVSSGANFIVVWSDPRAGASDRNVYSQAVDAAGSVLWIADGVAICTVTGSHQPFTVSGNSVGINITSDGSGGAVFTWDDARNSNTNTDVYAQRINSGGVVQWTANGVPVSTAANNQLMPTIVPTIGGAFIVSWRDGRTSANGEIYAARLQPTGVLPVHSLFVNAVTVKSAIEVKWTTVDESNTDLFVVEKSSDGAHFFTIGSVRAKGFGNGSYTLQDMAPVKGENFYRVKAVDQNKVFYYSPVTSAQYANSLQTSIALYPNPVRAEATLKLANLAKGNYQLVVRDVSGRLVKLQAITITNDYMALPISLGSLNAGTYFIQLVNVKGTVLSTTLQKQ